jgi:hypothetical protein
MQTSQNLIASAAAVYLKANTGHFESLCTLALATAFLQRERNKDGQHELSAATAAERATVAFEDALTVAGTMSAKTISNVTRTMRKGCAYAIQRIQKEKTLYTMEESDLTAAFFSAEFEKLEGFKPNLRDIDAAISAVNGTSRKATKAAKADKASGDSEAAQEAATAKDTASAAVKVAEAVKTLLAVASDVENHALFQSDEMGDLLATVAKIRRASASDTSQEAIAA